MTNEEKKEMQDRIVDEAIDQEDNLTMKALSEALQTAEGREKLAETLAKSSGLAGRTDETQNPQSQSVYTPDSLVNYVREYNYRVRTLGLFNIYRPLNLLTGLEDFITEYSKKEFEEKMAKEKEIFDEQMKDEHWPNRLCDLDKKDK